MSHTHIHSCRLTFTDVNSDLTKSPKSESTASVQQPLFQVNLGQLLGSSSSICSRREPLRTSGMGFYRMDTISVKTLKETRMTQPRCFFIHHRTPEGRGRAPFMLASNKSPISDTLKIIGENFYMPDLLDTHSVGQQMVSVH